MNQEFLVENTFNFIIDIIKEYGMFPSDRIFDNEDEEKIKCKFRELTVGKSEEEKTERDKLKSAFLRIVERVDSLGHSDFNSHRYDVDYLREILFEYISYEEVLPILTKEKILEIIQKIRESFDHIFGRERPSNIDTIMKEEGLDV